VVAACYPAGKMYLIHLFIHLATYPRSSCGGNRCRRETQLSLSSPHYAASPWRSKDVLWPEGMCNNSNEFWGCPDVSSQVDVSPKGGDQEAS